MSPKVLTPMLLLALAACGDPVERHIADLAEGGDRAAEARIRLNLAKQTAIEPLIAAFEDSRYPARARADLAQALYRLYLREADARLLAALIQGLQDPDGKVRAAVARSLGGLNKRDGVGPLVDQLGRDDNNEVRREILDALEMMGLGWGERVETDKMAPAQKERFTDFLVRIRREALPDSLRLKVGEWLETLAEEKAVAAYERVTKADLEGAEELLLSARELVPDSKNINQKLGRFYYFNGEPDKGLSLLAEQGMVTRARLLRQAPHLDGVLEEPAWRGIEPVTDFYQCRRTLGAYRTEGRSEAYLGYLGNTLYVGIKGYEGNTDSLAAQFRGRDNNKLWRDDCIEVFLDTNNDSRTYYQLVANCLGFLLDSYNDGSTRHGDMEWSGNAEVAVKVEPRYWVAELEIAVDQFHGRTIERGAVWGLNIGRIRIGNASEYGQWVPTYGAAHRPDRFGFLVFD